MIFRTFHDSRKQSIAHILRGIDREETKRNRFNFIRS